MMIPVFSHRTNWQLQANKFTQVLEQVRATGKPILDLTVSNPTRAGIAYDHGAILDSLHVQQALDYDPQPRGLACARSAVANYYRDRGDHFDPESLVLTTGTSEAYSFAFRLLANPGDEVLVPKPSYPLFDFLADLQDVELVPYPLIYDHGWQIDFHSLEKALGDRTRAIILVSPNNPTGSYVSAEERQRLNDICSTHELALIVDEVFLDYSLDGVTRSSFATNRDALTFTLSGVSKISALPQMKLAWIAVSGPEQQKQGALQRLEVIADTYLSVSTPIQLAADAMLAQRAQIQVQILGRMQHNLAELDRALKQQKACTRLAVQGGWYVVLRVPVTQSDEQLAIRLLQDCHVLVHPGHFYDFPQDGYLVLSLITPEKDFHEGVGRVLDFVADAG